MGSSGCRDDPRRSRSRPSRASHPYPMRPQGRAARRDTSVGPTRAQRTPAAARSANVRSRSAGLSIRHGWTTAPAISLAGRACAGGARATESAARAAQSTRRKRGPFVTRISGRTASVLRSGTRQPSEFHEASRGPLIYSGSPRCGQQLPRSGAHARRPPRQPAVSAGSSARAKTRSGGGSCSRRTSSPSCSRSGL
jgi:hypothetical protein